MGEIFRAPEEDWAEIESLSKEKFGCAYKGLCDLRDRVAALETARRAEVELLNAAHAQQQATVKESLTAEPAPADPEDREWITDRCPAPSETNFYGWVEVPASCRSSQPITEDGRRYTEYYLIDKGDPWLPASADYYNSRRALFDSGYKKGLEAGRAERRQEAATEESSAAHSEPANPDAPAPTEPAPPAPAGGLVEEHTRHISRLAWNNGAYVARSFSPPIDAFTPPTYHWEVRDMEDQFQAGGQASTLHEAMSNARGYAYQYAPCKVRVWTEKTIHEATFDD